MAAFPDTIAGLPLDIRTSDRARSMTLRLCVHSRCARLTLPPRTSARQALHWLHSKEAWLADQKARHLPPAVPFAPGVALPFGDGVLHLMAGSGRRAVHDGDMLQVPGDSLVFANRVRRWLAAEAVRRLAPPSHELAARIGKTISRVTAGDWRSRWGSCGNGRITYSWRLLLAPDFVQNALVAHEVAHLAEANHGPHFWQIAQDLYGGSHGPARRWLAAHGAQLHGYGAAA